MGASLACMEILGRSVLDPILPHSVNLYTELKRLMLNGELRNTLRLSLLPCLATAAALEFKITGSDKGIW